MAGSPKIAAIILAAGRSTRMGDVNKLLADFDGRPMIAQTVAQVEASRLEQIFVVTGHQAEEIEQALSGSQVQFVDNRDFHQGMATSLVAGIGAVGSDFDGAMILLGDMPLVSGKEIDALVATFSTAKDICVPVFNGKQGNPVLWGREYFPALLELKGDSGAKQLLTRYVDSVVEVKTPSRAVLQDFDTAEAFP